MMLQVTGLTKIFGGLRAVDNASLRVDEGRIVALIGPNGAGKTTLFACIAGFLPINAGRVEFLGRDITGLPVHEIARAGMVRTFQITQPFAKLTVHENIAVGAYQKFSQRAQAWAHAQAIAEQVGMAHMLAQPASELTVAGRKRLELAVAGGLGAGSTGSRLLSGGHPVFRELEDEFARAAGTPAALFFASAGLESRSLGLHPCGDGHGPGELFQIVESV
jgi:ABC-type branched-subunit amino acid transport system ATPase component